MIEEHVYLGIGRTLAGPMAVNCSCGWEAVLGEDDDPEDRWEFHCDDVFERESAETFERMSW